MKKLRLDPDALVVETFDAGTSARRAPGTVKGLEYTNFSCAQTDDDYTCWNTCAGTAAPADSCYQSCNNNSGCGTNGMAATDCYQCTF